MGVSTSSVILHGNLIFMLQISLNSWKYVYFQINLCGIMCKVYFLHIDLREGKYLPRPWDLVLHSLI